jgi:hypothetical protein
MSPSAEDIKALVDAPKTLTSLECKGVGGDKSPERQRAIMEMDLHAMLSMAAAFLGAGAPLQSLTLSQCRTGALVYSTDSEDSFGNKLDAKVVEPSKEEVVQLYHCLCEGLHGLKRLDLARSPHCVESVVNEVVSSAPDLISLGLHVSMTEGQVACSRVIPCSQLQEVLVHFNAVACRYDQRSQAFSFVLEDASGLQKCTLKLLDPHEALQPGDSARVVMGCQESAKLDTSVRKLSVDNGCGWGLTWELSIAVRPPEASLLATSRLKHVTVMFAYEADYEADRETWTTAVELG